jgi:hypothetical protein
VEYGEQEIAKPSNRKISAILLLGGFQVFDNNFTGHFIFEHQIQKRN